MRPTLAAVTLEPSGGGVATVARLLWQVLQREFGPDARLITLLPEGRRQPTLADKLRFGARVAQVQVAGATDWMLFSHLALAKAHDRVPGRIRCGYGIFLHGIEAWCPLSAQEQRLLREADLRIANSAFTAARVMSAHPDVGEVIPCPLALPEPLRTSPPPGTPVPSSTVQAITPPLRLGPHAVLVVGRLSSLERYKGHDQLIDAWPSVVASIPDAQLVIVGEGDDRARLEDQARRAGVAAHTVFTGFVDDGVLDALFERAALFALPSRGEGFGLVYLQAMQHGLACVGSTHDAAGEVIQDGVTGCLVDQADVPALGRTLVDLLGDPMRRRRMGEAGQQRARERFALTRFERQLTSLLRGTRDARVTPALV